MKRLYVQIYLTVIASLVLVVIAAGALLRFSLESSPWNEGMAAAAEVATMALPADAPREAQQRSLERLSQRLRADLALYDARREMVASVTLIPGAVPPAGVGRDENDHWDGDGGSRSWRMRLPDGRLLAIRWSREHRWPSGRLWGWPAWLATLLVIALAVGVAAHPVVRRITRRLERLEKSVNALGEGDLSARVRVHGHDEVARLAKSFNRAAARIESLVKSHRNLLANASHELRTPLARIRMGVELLKGRPPGKDTREREAQLEADIAELDALIEEILTASRLEAGAGADLREDIDFLALAAEECARYDDCRLDGPLDNSAAHVRGDPRLLRRMIRNLLENARRHGAPPIDVTVRNVTVASGLEAGIRGSDAGDPGAVQTAVELCVRDHGAGVPETESEKIFDPFYRLPGATATGTGLGLALVRQIARQHGGEARLVPAAGGGTCIEVLIAGAGR